MNNLIYSTSTAQANMARTGKAGMLAVAAAIRPTFDPPTKNCSERICLDCVVAMANGEGCCEETDRCLHGLFDGVPLGDHPLGIGWPVAELTEDEGSEFYSPWKPCPGCGTTDAGTWGTVTYL